MNAWVLLIRPTCIATKYAWPRTCSRIQSFPFHRFRKSSDFAIQTTSAPYSGKYPGTVRGNSEKSTPRYNTNQLFFDIRRLSLGYLVCDFLSTATSPKSQSKTFLTAKLQHLPDKKSSARALDHKHAPHSHQMIQAVAISYPNAGSIYSPFLLSAKCRCGPVERPVLPTAAIFCPAITLFPSVTRISWQCV